MITMGGFTLPSKTLREMIVVLDRRHRPGRAPARRLAPHHPHHRGARHGRRRHHHPGPVPLRHRSARTRTARIIGRHRSTGIGRPRFWDRARYYGEETRLAAALDAANAGRTRATSARSRESSFGSLTVLHRHAPARLVSAGSPRLCAPLPAASQTEKRVGRRLDQIQARKAAADAARRRGGDAAKRRKSVQETLKELEDKQKAQGARAQKPTLNRRACSRPG